jgi:hypothetical protein
MTTESVGRLYLTRQALGVLPPMLRGITLDVVEGIPVADIAQIGDTGWLRADAIPDDDDGSDHNNWVELRLPPNAVAAWLPKKSEPLRRRRFRWAGGAGRQW